MAIAMMNGTTGERCVLETQITCPDCGTGMDSHHDISSLFKCDACATKWHIDISLTRTDDTNGYLFSVGEPKRLVGVDLGYGDVDDWPTATDDYDPEAHDEWESQAAAHDNSDD